MCKKSAASSRHVLVLKYMTTKFCSHPYIYSMQSSALSWSLMFQLGNTKWVDLCSKVATQKLHVFFVAALALLLVLRVNFPECVRWNTCFFDGGGVSLLSVLAELVGALNSTCPGPLINYGSMLSSLEAIFLHLGIVLRAQATRPTFLWVQRCVHSLCRLQPVHTLLGCILCSQLTLYYCSNLLLPPRLFMAEPFHQSHLVQVQGVPIEEEKHMVPFALLIDACVWCLICKWKMYIVVNTKYAK